MLSEKIVVSGAVVDERSLTLDEVKVSVSYVESFFILLQPFESLLNKANEEQDRRSVMKYMKLRDLLQMDHNRKQRQLQKETEANLKRRLRRKHRRRMDRELYGSDDYNGWKPQQRESGFNSDSGTVDNSNWKVRLFWSSGNC